MKRYPKKVGIGDVTALRAQCLFLFCKIVLKYVNLTDGSPAPSTSTARVTRVTKRDKRLLKMDWKKKKSSNCAGNKLKKMVSCVPTADCLEEEACREMD